MKTFLILTLAAGLTFSQPRNLPSYYKYDQKLSEELKTIMQNLDLDKDFNVGEDGIEQISLTVIHLDGETAKFGGVNPDNFIYPASVYKMYVAAEVLNQISQGKFALTTEFIVKSPNDVDKGKEIFSDPRPLLKDGDTVTN